MIFRLWHEVETFSLVTYAGVPPAWKVLSRDQVIESLTDMMRDGDHLDASTLRQRPFLVAAGVLIPGNGSTGIWCSARRPPGREISG